MLEYEASIKEVKKAGDILVVSVNFCAEQFEPDFIFSSNMRRFARIQNNTNAKCIVTSNMKEAEKKDYVVNFASYSLKEPEIMDNSGLMALKLLTALGVKEVLIAGMDGYSPTQDNDYYDKRLQYTFSEGAQLRNKLIFQEIVDIRKKMSITFLTPTQYEE